MRSLLGRHDRDDKPVTAAPPHAARRISSASARVGQGLGQMHVGVSRAAKSRKTSLAVLRCASIILEALARRLKEDGIEENAASIANKLSRGRFAATFFLASLAAIGCQSIGIENL